MTALEQIMIGIEMLPISAKKKNEYMLELMYVWTDEHYSHLRGFSSGISLSPSHALNQAFVWSSSHKFWTYWRSLHDQLLMNKVS